MTTNTNSSSTTTGPRTVLTTTAAEMTVGGRYRGTLDGPTEVVSRDFTVEAMRSTVLDADPAGDGSEAALEGIETTLLVHERDGKPDERAEVTFALGDTVTYRPRFKAGYESSTERILRERINVGADGVATVTFMGTVHDATTCWITRGSSGRMSIYGEVGTEGSHATRMRLAVVPTGKRIPLIDGGTDGPAMRLGSEAGQHVYLLSVEPVSKAQVAAEAAAKRAARKAAEAALARVAAGENEGVEAECVVCTMGIIGIGDGQWQHTRIEDGSHTAVPAQTA